MAKLTVWATRAFGAFGGGFASICPGWTGLLQLPLHIAQMLPPVQTCQLGGATDHTYEEDVKQASEKGSILSPEIGLMTQFQADMRMEHVPQRHVVDTLHIVAKDWERIGSTCQHHPFSL